MARNSEEEITMENSRERSEQQRKDSERSALLAAQAFIIFSGIYWFLQFESVLELLELAYG